MPGCPSEIDKLLWLSDELANAADAGLTVHVKNCPNCSESVAALQAVIATVKAQQTGMAEDSQACMDEADMALLVDGRPSEPVRKVALAHLASCSRCRRAIASLMTALGARAIVTALEDTERARQDTGRTARTGSWVNRQRTWRVGAVAAVAAAIAGLLFLRPTSVDVDSTRVHREAADAPGAAPLLESPSGAIDLPVEFRWSSTRSADRYRLTVFNNQGTALWEVETESTVVGMPDTITLEPGVQYRWKVAARVGWDRWVDSDLMPFTIPER